MTTTHFRGTGQALHWLLLFIGLNFLFFISLTCIPFINSFSSIASITPFGPPNKMILVKAFLSGFTIANYLSFFMVLACLGALLIFISVFFTQRRAVISMLAVTNFTLLSMLLVLDNVIFSMFQFHITPSLVLNVYQIFPLVVSNQAYWLLTLAVTGIFFIELLIAWLVSKLTLHIKLKALVGTVFASFLTLGSCYGVLITSMLYGNSLFAQQTIPLPLYNFLFSVLTNTYGNQYGLNYFTEQSFKVSEMNPPKLYYPSATIECTPPKKPYNILVLMVDTLRADSFNPKEMPYLYQRKNQFITFNNHWSGGNATQPGLFSLFYSLPPNYWFATLQQQRPPLLTQQLKQIGYSLHAFWSSIYSFPDFDKNMLLNYDQLFSAYAHKKQLPDKNDITITAKVTALLQQANTKPFFMQVLYDAVHGYCTELQIPKIFQPEANKCLSIFYRSKTDNFELYNRYRNAVRFSDQQLEKIFKVLDQTGRWKNTIVIVSSDHGEEFNDNEQGYWGHTSNYTQYQLKVPMLIHWPGMSATTINYQTQHYDLVPTLMENLLQCSSPKAHYSVGNNLFSPIERELLIAGSYVNSAFINEKYIYLLTNAGGIEVQTSTAKPLKGGQLDKRFIKKGLTLMQKYYVPALVR